MSTKVKTGQRKSANKATSTGKPSPAAKSKKIEPQTKQNGAGINDQSGDDFLFCGTSPQDQEDAWIQKILQLLKRKKTIPTADQFTETLQIRYDDLLKELCSRCGEKFIPIFNTEEDTQSDAGVQMKQTPRDNYNEKLAESASKLNDLKEEKEKIEQELSHSKEATLKYDKKVAEYSKEIDEMTDENKQLKSKLTETEKKCLELKAQQQETSKSVDVIDKNELQVRLSNQDKMLKQNLESIDNLKSKNEDLLKQIDGTQNSLKDAENNVAKLSKENEKHRVVLEEQTTKRKALENENSDLQKKLENSISSIDKLKSENLSQGKTDTSNREQIDRLLGENERLKVKEKELTTQIVNKEKEIQKLHEHVNILKAEKESLETVVAQIKNQVGQEVDKHSKKSENLSQNLKSKEHEILDLKRTKSEIDRNNTSLQKQVDEISAALKRLEEEKNKVKKEKKFASKAPDQKVKELQDENDKLRDRLSQIAGSKLTQGNPAIADLGDPNRPTLLGEKFSELYDNEWTDAMEELGGNDEKSNINTLKTIVEKAYEFGKTRAANFAKGVEKALLELSNSIEVSDVIAKYIKDHRKNISLHVTDGLYKSFIGSHTEYNIGGEGVKNFIKKSVSLCWLMAIQDPSVILTTKISGKFDTDRFRHYTKSGSTVDYVVWPVVFLHEGGPIICKGVAQGK